MITKQKVIRAFFILSILFAGSFTYFSSAPTVAAAPCAQEVAITDQCVQSNFNDAKNAYPSLTASQYTDIVNKCNGENSSVGFGGFYFVDAEFGNCSNSVASCYKNVIDKRSCGDSRVIAMGTSCDNGNINADGQCGFDEIIDIRNQIDGGEDFNSNKGVRQSRIDERIAAECQGAGSVSDIENCKTRIAQMVDKCYSSNGGTASDVNDQKYSNCIQSAASTEQECRSRGGSWAQNKCQSTSANSNVKKCYRADGVNFTEVPVTDACPTGTTETIRPNTSFNGNTNGTGCGGVETNIISCSGSGKDAIVDVLKQILIILTAGVGIVAVGGIVYGALLYSSAQDNAGQTQKAVTIITNTVIGLLLYVFMFAIINWLLPGNVLG